jgi:hypothetical protein
MLFVAYHIRAIGDSNMGREDVCPLSSDTMIVHNVSIRFGHCLARAAWATEFQIYASLSIHLKIDLSKAHSAG